jgi:2-amino-4-hydroxy-6-hydroxymethyldihydropteridine diphosphokinase
VREVIGYVALGSNVGDRRANLALGLAGMAERALAPTLRSSIWESEPVGTTAPAWFLNMVVRIRSSKTALDVLDDLLDIERVAGRTRTATRNAPRTLDLDLLTLGDSIVASERLTLPHPRMWQRRFVLAPLAEIDPDLVNPGNGKTVLQALRELDDAFEVRKLAGAVAVPSARPL